MQVKAVLFLYTCRYTTACKAIDQAMASTSPEMQTVRKCLPKITEVMACNIDWFTSRLIANNLLMQSNMDNTGVDKYAKAGNLMQSVMTQISVEHSGYDKFRRILEESGFLEPVLKLLDETYGEIDCSIHLLFIVIVHISILDT